jgi:hypothetical protein
MQIITFDSLLAFPASMRVDEFADVKQSRCIKALGRSVKLLSGSKLREPVWGLIRTGVMARYSARNQILQRGYFTMRVSHENNWMPLKMAVHADSVIAAVGGHYPFFQPSKTFHRVP